MLAQREIWIPEQILCSDLFVTIPIKKMVVGRILIPLMLLKIPFLVGNPGRCSLEINNRI